MILGFPRGEANKYSHYLWHSLVEHQYLTDLYNRIIFTSSATQNNVFSLSHFKCFLHLRGIAQTEMVKQKRKTDFLNILNY